ncbi:hypothetical protein J5Y04_39330 [Kitasatospora sp. RG8]|uniref:hypothetical protein n=1 Tax=Kitasatospora sp. RG8 TaxID=2820815 RepID=UPI001ADF2AF7|nr:hypothetical protein [Kitasatospora sp. RG8]MBP0455530.1 hypothetical protein [Kitasatospora sp. RG8]
MAFEPTGPAPALDHARRLHRAGAAGERARRAVRRLLGPPAAADGSAGPAALPEPGEC